MQTISVPRWSNPTSFNLPVLGWLPYNQLGTNDKAYYEDYAKELHKLAGNTRYTDKLDNNKYRIILENIPETSCMMGNLKSHLRKGILKNKSAVSID